MVHNDSRLDERVIDSHCKVTTKTEHRQQRAKRFHS